jgi:hypothetical protein
MEEWRNIARRRATFQQVWKDLREAGDDSLPEGRKTLIRGVNCRRRAKKHNFTFCLKRPVAPLRSPPRRRAGHILAKV